MKKQLITLLALTILFTGCSKADLNEEANNDLEGSWELVSKKVDGEEWIGNYYAAEFKFEKTGPTTGKWHEIYTDQNGIRESFVTYVVKEEGTKVVTEIPITYNIEFSENTLEIDGIFSGSTFEFLMNKE